VLCTAVDPASADVNVLSPAEDAVVTTFEPGSRRLEVEVLGRAGVTLPDHVSLFARVVRKDAELSPVALLSLAPVEPDEPRGRRYYLGGEQLPDDVDADAIAVEITSEWRHDSVFASQAGTSVFGYERAEHAQQLERGVQRALAYERLGYACYASSPPSSGAYGRYFERAAQAWDEVRVVAELDDPAGRRAARARGEAEYVRRMAGQPPTGPGEGPRPGRAARSVPFVVEWVRLGPEAPAPA
jgi:hypothetical protein